jgi:hypothetical protein
MVCKALPLLDASDSVARYAWFSTRNAPAAWVAESSLLPYTASHAMPCDAMPCDAMRCDAMRCDAMRDATPRHATPRHDMT